MYRVFMADVDPETFLREMAAPLGAAREGEALPGVPFSLEAVANAFVMLGLLPEARAEAILAGHRAELEARGFRFGVLTGELSVRPGAHGYQESRTVRRSSLAGVPLATMAETIPVPFGDIELAVTSAVLTPGGVRLGLRASGTVDDGVPAPGRRPVRVTPGRVFSEKIQAGLSVHDDLGREYRLRPRGGGGPLPAGPGQPVS
jgi:hypothetical protein